MSKENLVVAVIGIAGSYASFAGLILTMKPTNRDLNTIEILWLLGLLGLVAYALFILYKQYKLMTPKVYKTDEDIAQYMFNWISKAGRVAICSRDMSWGNAPTIKKMLIDKARNHEVCIYVPRHTELTQALATEGAEVYTYEELEHIPTSRFTIVDKDKDYARVAVGRKIDGQHIIEEYSVGAHPVFSVANDLVEVIKKYNEKIKKA